MQPRCQCKHSRAGHVRVPAYGSTAADPPGLHTGACKDDKCSCGEYRACLTNQLLSPSGEKVKSNRDAEPVSKNRARLANVKSATSTAGSVSSWDFWKSRVRLMRIVGSVWEACIPELGLWANAKSPVEAEQRIIEQAVLAARGAVS